MKEIKTSSELVYKKSASSIFIDHLHSAMSVLAYVTTTILALLVIISMMNDVPSNVLQSLIWLVFTVIYVIGSLGYAVIRTVIDYRGQGGAIPAHQVVKVSGKGCGVFLPVKDKISEPNTSNTPEPSKHSKISKVLFLSVSVIFIGNSLYMSSKLESAGAVDESNHKLALFVGELVDAQSRVWCMGFTSNYDNDIERKAALAKCEKAVKSDQIRHEVILPNKSVISFFENATMENKVKEMTTSKTD